MKTIRRLIARLCLHKPQPPQARPLPAYLARHQAAQARGDFNR